MTTPRQLASPDGGNGSSRGSIGYVFSGRLEPSTFEEVVQRLRPRSEYHVFGSRLNTQLFMFENISEGGTLARLLGRLGRPVTGIAVAALQYRPRYQAPVATGENVGFPAALYSRLARISIPISVITHGSFFGSPYMHAAALMLRSISNVRYLTICETLREQMISRFGFPRERVVNTSYGVDTEFFEPRDNESGPRPVIASAGTATRDYRTLVAATHDLDADVRIAADSAWFPTAVDISADRLPANCEARSYVNYVALRELYASAAFVVVPLYPAFHACGLAVIAEAMAMGKAVITTRIAAHSDFIVEGENGFYVPPGDVDALRKRIQLLLDDPERARVMGAAARKRIAGRFTLEAYVDRMLEAMGE